MGQSRIDNPDKLATLGTQDTRQNERQRKLKGQSRKTIQINWQHWVQKTQDKINVREN